MRLPTLPPPRGSPSYDLTISSAPQAPTLVVPQLTAVRTSINTCLDVIDVTTWTGDSTDANFVASQLRLLYDHIQEGRQALKGYSDVQSAWWETPVDDKVGTHSKNSGVQGCGSQLTHRIDIRSSTALKCFVPPLHFRCCPCPRDPDPRNTECGRGIILHGLQFP